MVLIFLQKKSKFIVIKYTALFDEYIKNMIQLFIGIFYGSINKNPPLLRYRRGVGGLMPNPFGWLYQIYPKHI